MKLATFLLLAVITMSAQQMKWHRATRKECNAEIHREEIEMAKHGMEGDPGMSIVLVIDNRSYDPCGYTNGKEFRPRCTLFDKGREHEISCENLWGPHQSPEFNYGVH